MESKKLIDRSPSELKEMLCDCPRAMNKQGVCGEYLEISTSEVFYNSAEGERIILVNYKICKQKIRE